MSRVWCFLRFFCLILLIGGLRAQAPLPAEDQSRLADGLFSRGLYELALEEYQRLLEQLPKVGNPERIAFRAAESARHLKKHSEAERYYQQVITLAPGTEVAQRSRYRLAEQALAMGKLPQAEAQLQSVVEARPGPPLEPSARFLLGQVLETAGNSSRALEQYRALVKAFPREDVAGYAHLRIAALSNQSAEERRKAYQSGIERAQNDDMRVEALWGLAVLETAEKNHEEAARLYWELWTRFANHPRIREGMIYLAWAQLQAEKFERALELYEKTSEPRRARAADTWVYLQAVSLQRLGRNEEARTAYEDLLARFPQSRFRAMAGYETAALYAAAGEHEKVLQYAEEILQVPGREAEGLWMLAESARASGDMERAIRSYTRLIREVPQSPLATDAHYVRAMLMRESQPREAARALEEFARRNPKDPRAARALASAGETLLSEGDAEKAFDLWNQSLKIAAEPDAQRIRRTGLLALRLEKDKAAEALLTQSLALDLPEEAQAESRYWLGVVQERGGRAEAAINSYAQALKEAPSAPWANRARLRLGRLYQQAEKETEALEAFLPLVSDAGTPMSDGLLIWLLDVAEREGSAEDQVTLATALQQPERSPEMRELGAYAEAGGLQQLNRIPEAIRAWQRGLALGSRSLDAAEAALALGDALIAEDRADEAVAAFSTSASIASALEQGRLQAQALAGLGRAERAQGNWEAAGRHFLSVSVLFDDAELVPDCLDAAAECFDRAGQPARAEAARRERQQRYPDAAPAASPPDPKETP